MTRISIQSPGLPRFSLVYEPQTHLTLKHFLHYLCQQLGFQPPTYQVIKHGKPEYYLMQGDQIVLSLDAVRDGDRLTLIQSSEVASYVTGLNSKAIVQPSVQLQLSYENQQIINRVQNEQR